MIHAQYWIDGVRDSLVSAMLVSDTIGREPLPERLGWGLALRIVAVNVDAVQGTLFVSTPPFLDDRVRVLGAGHLR